MKEINLETNLYVFFSEIFFEGLSKPLKQSFL